MYVREKIPDTVTLVKYYQRDTSAKIFLKNRQLHSISSVSIVKKCQKKNYTVVDASKFVIEIVKPLTLEE